MKEDSGLEPSVRRSRSDRRGAGESGLLLVLKS
jgi:hypothetical protein